MTMPNPPDERDPDLEALAEADARTTGFSSNVDLEKLFQEAEQTVNRIIHSKKDHKDERLKPPPSEPVPPREIELKLAQAQEDLDEQQRRYQQLEQDFLNFRERTERQSSFAVLRGNSELLKQMLEILDTFDFARNTFNSDKFGHTVDSYRKGFDLLYRQFASVMDKIGLTRIPTEGRPFDPNLHQAIEAEESESYEAPVIIRELKTGYTYRDILLRPSMVKVGVPPKRAPGQDLL
jgi:molecular chaperone GrpE